MEGTRFLVFNVNDVAMIATCLLDYCTQSFRRALTLRPSNISVLSPSDTRCRPRVSVHLRLKSGASEGVADTWPALDESAYQV